MPDKGSLIFPRSVASLDVETLALDNYAAVTEVGIVVATLVQTDSGRVEVSDPVDHHLRFNVLDQIARGRAMSPQTWVFHLKHSGVVGLHDQIAQGLLLDEQGTRNSLNYIQNILMPVSEIWINGLSFDPVILSTLAQNYELETKFDMSRLWAHSKERDVRTVNRTAPDLNAPKAKSSHRALDDAKWNLEVVAGYYSLLTRLSPSKEIATPDAGSPENVVTATGLVKVLMNGQAGAVPE